MVRCKRHGFPLAPVCPICPSQPLSLSQKLYCNSKQWHMCRVIKWAALCAGPVSGKTANTAVHLLQDEDMCSHSDCHTTSVGCCIHYTSISSTMETRGTTVSSDMPAQVRHKAKAACLGSLDSTVFLHLPEDYVHPL